MNSRGTWGPDSSRVFEFKGEKKAGGTAYRAPKGMNEEGNCGEAGITSTVRAVAALWKKNPRKLEAEGLRQGQNGGETIKDVCSGPADRAQRGSLSRPRGW